MLDLNTNYIYHTQHKRS